MDASVVVNIILCVLSFILAAISVVTVVITLQQNSRMIENATRPYLVVYSEKTNIGFPTYYLCVKNLGQSGATISQFSCDKNLGEISFSSNVIPFQHLEGTFLAPGQTIYCSIDYTKAKDFPPVTFSLAYTANSKKYEETITISFDAYSDLLLLRTGSKDEPLKAIASAMQELVEKNL